jgi:hypothetical protein
MLAPQVKKRRFKVDHDFSSRCPLGGKKLCISQVSRTSINTKVKKKKNDPVGNDINKENTSEWVLNFEIKDDFFFYPIFLL